MSQDLLETVKDGVAVLTMNRPDRLNALACDLRIAGESAKFGTAFARVGYSGDFGGSYYLTQLVGTAKARELYYTAELVDARHALELGLVNRVVADDRLEEETLLLAAK